VYVYVDADVDVDVDYVYRYESIDVPGQLRIEYSLVQMESIISHTSGSEKPSPRKEDFSTSP
jgi:hypothetical protein